jgi:hypothetical protein
MNKQEMCRAMQEAAEREFSHIPGESAIAYDFSDGFHRRMHKLLNHRLHPKIKAALWAAACVAVVMTGFLLLYKPPQKITPQSQPGAPTWPQPAYYTLNREEDGYTLDFNQLAQNTFRLPTPGLTTSFAGELPAFSSPAHMAYSIRTGSVPQKNLQLFYEAWAKNQGAIPVPDLDNLYTVVLPGITESSYRWEVQGTWSMPFSAQCGSGTFYSVSENHFNTSLERDYTNFTQSLNRYQQAEETYLDDTRQIRVQTEGTPIVYRYFFYRIQRDSDIMYVRECWLEADTQLQPDTLDVWYQGQNLRAHIRFYEFTGQPRQWLQALSVSKWENTLQTENFKDFVPAVSTRQEIESAVGACHHTWQQQALYFTGDNQVVSVQYNEDGTLKDVYLALPNEDTFTRK